MITLVIAMTAGALILLALEGKPIQPMPFSLYHQGQLTAVETALQTDTAIEPGRWLRIDVSYRTNQDQLSPQYRPTGELAQKYHFIISDQNSSIFASQRWYRQLPCFSPPNGLSDPQTIKICLFTHNPSRPASTHHQVRQLQELIEYLQKNYHIEPNIAWMPD